MYLEAFSRAASSILGVERLDRGIYDFCRRSTPQWIRRN